MDNITKKIKDLFLKEIVIYNQLIIDKQNENKIAKFFDIKDLNIIAKDFFNNKECIVIDFLGKKCCKKSITKKEFIGTEYESMCLTHINIIKNGKKESKEILLKKNLNKLIDNMEKIFLNYLEDDYLSVWNGNYVDESNKALKERNEWIILNKNNIKNCAKRFVNDTLNDHYCLNKEDKLNNLNYPELPHMAYYIISDFPELEIISCIECTSNECDKHQK